MPFSPGTEVVSVVHFASGDLWGGAEAVVFTLIREQHRRNPGSVACVVLNAGQLADRLRELGVPLLVLDESRQGMLELARASARFVEAQGSKVLHAHRRKENLLAWLIARRRFGKSRRLARVTTIHGMPEPVAGGSGWRRRLTEFVNDLTMARGFDALVAVSLDIERQMKSRFPGAPVTCVHNGVESHPVSPAVPGAGGPRALRLLALGRLVPIKRFDRLRGVADALNALGVLVEITLGGDGPLQAELTRTLSAGENGGTIHMPGFVAQPQRLFETADALLITSDHEGIPMVALEALTRGIPVFGFNVGGLPEIAASGVAMQLAPPGDVQAMAQLIHTYFGGAEPMRQLPPARWKFSIGHCADDYEKLYTRVAGLSADSRKP